TIRPRSRSGGRSSEQQTSRSKRIDIDGRALLSGRRAATTSSQPITSLSFNSRRSGVAARQCVHILVLRTLTVPRYRAPLPRPLPLGPIRAEQTLYGAS